MLYDITDNLVFLTQGAVDTVLMQPMQHQSGLSTQMQDCALTNGDIVKPINGNMTDPNVGMTGWGER